MLSIRAASRFALAFLFVTAAAGCGGGDDFSTARVSGVVTLNGTPLAKASVVFQPAAAGNPGPPSSGETDDKGMFSLRFTDGREGVVIGKHRVYISTRKMESTPNSDSEVEVATEQVPDSYRRSPPTFEVPKGGTDKADFKLSGPPTGG